MNIFDKLSTLGPEIALMAGACVTILLGLWPSQAMRRLAPWAAALALIVSGVLTLRSIFGPQFASSDDTVGWMVTVPSFIRLAVVGMGLLLLAVAAAVPDQLKQIREAESARRFEPGLVFRGEFFAFFLLSLSGVMLTAAADDLVWLFLALELTSLPTYVMVAISRDRIQSQEAAVKYFFLGALAAAVFLYGFTLIYGATGYTRFDQIRAFTATLPTLPPLMLVGMAMAIAGIAFKIAAVPMHFYAADVYQGAATPVTAFLAFVPKAAGFVALILLLSLIPAPLPSALLWLLWVMAALTMTVGNVLGLLQTNVKRVLAYSSVAHSGYMLVGLLAAYAVAPADGLSTLGDGLGAVLFYLVAYGLATLASFAVLACLQTDGDETQEYEDISGLARRSPALAAVMLLGVLSLIGLPPLVGFVGKIYLFGSAISNAPARPELLWLVVIAVLNSAVSAVYYLRIVSACFFGDDAQRTAPLQARGRALAASIAAVAALVLGFAGSSLIHLSHTASQTTRQLLAHDRAPATPIAPVIVVPQAHAGPMPPSDPAASPR